MNGCQYAIMVHMDDTYLESWTWDLAVDGEAWYVVLHMGLVDDRVVPVGIEMRSHLALEETWGKPPLKLPPDRPEAAYGLHELKATTLRGFSLPRLAEATMVRLGLEERIRGVEPGLYLEDVPRRGPRPNVPDSVVQQIVVPAYQRGGARPVEAVRSAVKNWRVEQGMEPYDQITTREEAASLVRRARRRGWLSKPSRGGGDAARRGPKTAADNERESK